MGLRSSGRKYSFDILSETNTVEDDDSHLMRRSNSFPSRNREAEIPLPTENPKNRKRKKHKKKKPPSSECAMIPEDPASSATSRDAGADGVTFEIARDSSCQSFVSGGTESATSVCTVVASENGYNYCELRQRSISGNEEAESRVEESSTEKQQRRSEPNGVVTKLETAESLDWKRLMAEDPNCK